jgi:diacylglycerol O-acyltransferase / wax synthase
VTLAAMERMTGMDAGFLYMETPSLHMHTLKIGVIDPVNVAGGYTFEKFREELAKRLHLLPPFRRRIVEVPGGFYHPVWIEDPDFELDRHLKRTGVPTPGGAREMDALIGEIASTPLKRDRPLWEIWALEGLQDGHVAFVAKIHHSLADGVAAAALLANVLTVDPEPADPPPPEREWRGEPIPDAKTLSRAASRERRAGVRGIPALFKKTRAGAKELSKHRETATIRPPRPMKDVPHTSFNGPLSPNRAFATTTLALEDFKTVKSKLGVTINDVVLSVAGGSVRRYLDARGEKLDRSLVAGVPVSSDKPEDAARLGGNKVSNMFTTLATDIADPVQRVKAIHEVTKEAKVAQNILGADTMANWLEYAPPRGFSWFMRQYSGRRWAAKHRPPINMVVSNVPGPRTPLYIAGAKLAALYSVGPILEGIGLNITVWSYIDQMNFAAISCRELLPEVHKITDGIHDALDELLKAADRA